MTAPTTTAATLRLAPGRYVVETTADDGARFVGEVPLLVPATGEAVVRLRANGR